MISLHNKIICIGGPTGAGKTAAALYLAGALERAGLGCAVLNADSRQVYRDFPLITAQPDAEERGACPHYLYGFMGITEKISAGEYVRLAQKRIEGLWALGILPLLVGGTGLYFRSLLHGIASIPEIPEPVRRKWQERRQNEGSPALHALLQEVDPELAARLHPNDSQRVTRGLEVWEGTGRTLSHWHRLQREGRGGPDNCGPNNCGPANSEPAYSAQGGHGLEDDGSQSGPYGAPDNDGAHEPYDYLFLGVGLDLADLEPRLAQRIDVMLEAGALEEARAALELCADPSAPGWSGIGCAELYRHLAGELPLPECKALWLKNTRAYAKRQLTWFRSEKELEWFRPGQEGALARRALAWLGLAAL
ncbi:tRNA (adenosine(37)-N6)-dimethylallyltransferase MiaA [Desulfovibrio sp. OttesenSCG-928-C14]|nr:tRNA (adenosine(37)-N6)-dimethylallyltransferase MiaA [Desulfovibrio sp. OttesenSCG-928-C14]